MLNILVEKALEKNLVKFYKSPVIRARSLRNSKAKSSSTIFSSSNPNEVCDRLKSLQQELEAGKISNTFVKENIATADKRIEYNCLSTKYITFLFNQF